MDFRNQWERLRRLGARWAMLAGLAAVAGCPNSSSAPAPVPEIVSNPPPSTDTAHGAVAISASPRTIDEGGSAVVSWSSTGLSGCTISGVGSVLPSGSAEISPAETTTYTFTCASIDGPVSAEVEVEVIPVEPVSHFQLIAKFNVPDGHVAEIVSISPDGMLAAYTNAGNQTVEFLDISDPENPWPVGLTDLSSINSGSNGEPTSVDFTPNGQYAVAAVLDTTDGLDENPGNLVFISTSDFSVWGSVELGIGPDSVKVTPNGAKAVVAIEDEEEYSENPDPGDYRPGAVQVVTINYSSPSSSTVATLQFSNGTTGIALPEDTNNEYDAQPEYVDITSDSNTAIVSLQENNLVAVVNIAGASPSLIRFIDMGTVTRTGNADLPEDKNINLVDSFTGRREPDTVCVLPGNTHFITANEGDTSNGDFDGNYAGGRGFSVFPVAGGPVSFEVGAALEQTLVRYGQYDDTRSGNRGAEVEGCTVGVFDSGTAAAQRTFGAVLAERSSAALIYDFGNQTSPSFVQMLPAPLAPESAEFIPSRNLLVVAGEGLEVGSTRLRGQIWIYEAVRDSEEPFVGFSNVLGGYSEDYDWGAMGSLAWNGSFGSGSRLYSSPDNAYKRQRIWTLQENDETQRYEIVDELLLTQADGTTALEDYDPEGIAVNPEGGWIIASEGTDENGKSNAVQRNRILFFNDSGALADPNPSSNSVAGTHTVAGDSDDGIVDLPGARDNNVGFTNPINWNRVSRFGYEGVTVVDTNPGATGGLKVYVCLQRPLGDDGNNSTTYLHGMPDELNGAIGDVGGQQGYTRQPFLTRIGEYDVDANVWKFYLYPLEPNQADGTLSYLSEITYLGGNYFAVIERDNLAAGLAKVKRIYGFSLDGADSIDSGDTALSTPLTKTLLADLLDLEFRFDFEKIEGMALTGDGLILSTDNDGGGQATFFARLPQFRVINED